MPKEAIKIGNYDDLKKSTLELLFRIYFDSLSRSGINEATGEITIIIANDSSDYWADITRVMNSDMHISDIKKGLIESNIFNQNVFNKAEFERLSDYDYFTISGDYKASREVAKYTIVFKFPEWINANNVTDTIRSIQNALMVGLIKQDDIPGVIDILVEAIHTGNYDNKK
jgi:hypothetical protein